jgi:hypothetical protein
MAMFSLLGRELAINAMMIANIKTAAVRIQPGMREELSELVGIGYLFTISRRRMRTSPRRWNRRRGSRIVI